MRASSKALRIGRLRLALCGLAIGVGGLALVGTALGVPWLADTVAGEVPTMPGEALALIGLGLYVLGLHHRRFHRLSPWAAVGATGLAVAALLHLPASGNGLEEAVRSSALPLPHRLVTMSPATAATLALFGTSGLLLRRRGSTTVALAHGLAALALVAPLIALFGHAFGLPALYRVGAHPGMSLPSLAALAAIGAALWLTRPPRFVRAFLTAETHEASTVRRLVPAVLGAVVCLGWAATQGARQGLYQPGLAMALMAIATVLVVGLMVVLHARTLGIAEDERLRHQRVLQENDRRKSEFLAMLSHELRNPLSAVVSASHLVQDHELDRAARDEAASVLRRQLKHIIRLLDDLLDVSRIERGNIELNRRRTRLAPALRQAVEAVRPIAEFKRHQLHVDLDAVNGVRIMGDRVRLVQIFSNLLHNAAKYTPPGGRITFEARRHGPAVELRVTDDGVGMTSEELARAFDLFVQSNRALARTEGGLGLGLTLAQRLVTLHGGQIEARSEGRGAGTTFVVTLPIEEIGTDSRRLVAGGSKRAPVRQRRVLVVDDNEDAAMLLSMQLRREGCLVDTAHDGEAALDRAARRRPDLVLLDIGLPGMDGYEVAGHLRERFGDEVRVIAVTGYGQPADVRRAHQAGFDRHLVKPLDPSVLDEVLREAPGPDEDPTPLPHRAA